MRESLRIDSPLQLMPKAYSLPAERVITAVETGGRDARQQSVS